jgi:hypothetical protein
MSGVAPEIGCDVLGAARMRLSQRSTPMKFPRLDALNFRGPSLGHRWISSVISSSAAPNRRSR